MLYIALYFIPALVMVMLVHIFMHKHYTIKEMIAQAIITLVLVISIVLIDGSVKTTDSKIVHGVVSHKQPIQKYCRTTWQTYQDSWCDHHYTKVVSNRVKGADGKWKTEYTTYYKPVYSWERKYFVETTLGSYQIKRVDPQGVTYPERYNIVKNGDPVSGTSNYKNYVGAVSSSLFKYEDDSYPDMKVVPNKIYDYYHLDQFYSDNVDVNDTEINKKLSILNSSLKSGANIFIYVTDKPEDFANSLQVKWAGFKINDVAIVLGVDKDTNKYQYVNVYSWSDSSMVEVELKDFLLSKDYTTLSSDLTSIGSIVDRTFKHADPEKFAYLKAQIGLSWFSTILLVIITMIVTPVVTYFLAKD